jgi:hypothetical protein
MSYIDKTVGDSVVLGVVLTKNGAPLTGLLPTLELRRGSDDKYFDFSASMAPYWLSTGGSQTIVIPEVSWLPGYYRWTFDQGMYDAGPNEYTAIYRNVSPYSMMDIEIVNFANEFTLDVSLIRKMLTNKQTLKSVSATHMEHKVFDDDKVTEIYAASLDLDNLNATETRDPV